MPQTLSVAMALFCGQLAISLLGRSAPPDRSAAARCALAALVLLVVFGTRLVARLARRGPGLRAGAHLLAAATLSFVVGTLELWATAPGRIPSPGLRALGLSPEAWMAARPLGFELCGLLAVLSLCAGHANTLATRRAEASLDRTAATRLRDGASHALDVSGRALGVAGVAFAAFAAVLHAALGAGPLGPTTLTAPIAVLAGCSVAAFWLGAPAARALALTRARALGLRIRDLAAFDRLARVDVLCVEAEPGITSDAIAAVRALRDRGVAVYLVGDRRPEVLRLVAARLGARALTAPDAMTGALHVRDLQHAGAWVAVVGAGGGLAAARADLSIAFASTSQDGAGAAELVLGPTRLQPLASAIDLSRALRARLREGAIFAALVNAILIPCAVLGWCPPAIAALVALLEALLVLTNAMRLPATPRPRTETTRKGQRVAILPLSPRQPMPALDTAATAEALCLPQPSASGNGHILPAPSVAR
ncbi:hypothetical protein [Chondromyces crocatus]|uniref:Uncharacterized protein n=1 Tax=Chondromyces crocatus TaxID=52 RepID=A0A0K1EHL0_CHOCO|nr:hypothetical protein [Chondromyces crocatus]AKT40162.1 uncharacterized protein CMC5_043150 [Chondromyces crocatus]